MSVSTHTHGLLARSAVQHHQLKDCWCLSHVCGTFAYAFTWGPAVARRLIQHIEGAGVCTCILEDPSFYYGRRPWSIARGPSPTTRPGPLTRDSSERGGDRKEEERREESRRDERRGEETRRDERSGDERRGEERRGEAAAHLATAHADSQPRARIATDLSSGHDSPISPRISPTYTAPLLAAQTRALLTVAAPSV